ncbi:AAA family ATPase [Bacillus taeanensis]|uniref:Nuclease SbcCD subunit C n=1 Tax=Bacillus taeanensis TaxID=273032 RepID=A0A366Y2D0_9BACI|nr:SMC family ATPase [Bacillus taeanensis]RBW71149.1 SMC family ATPase [Bacillus taeanensis]
MKPIKLTMTAFGPYKHTEVVDFNQLEHHRLFVISGSTGAGKTTIFDAICFALFGEASGEERHEAKMLRSHFADDDVHTAVELEFQIHSRKYRVLRQIPHVKEGNKTATGERYELYEYKDGEESPCVERFKVTDVNQKIEAILGLTKDQFSQIVMLPQGEFRKLLTSETENKEEILRRIFKTHSYKQIAEKLREKKKAIQTTFEAQVREREIYMNQLKGLLPERDGSELIAILSEEHYNTHQVLTALNSEISFYEKEAARQLEVLNEADQAYHTAYEIYHTAKAINDRFILLDEKRKHQEELLQKEDIIKEKEQNLKLAELAANLEIYEKSTNDAKNDVIAKENILTKAKAAKAHAEKALHEAKAAYEIEEKKEEQREQLAKELNRLKEFLPIVEELDKKQKSVRKLERERDKFFIQLNGLIKQLQDEQQQKIELMNQIRPLEQSVELLPEKTDTLTKLREQSKGITTYINKREETKAAYNEAKALFETFNITKSSFDFLEKRWIEGQASFLALHLEAGSPCPVCGSTEHPEKAAHHTDIPTKEELDYKKQEKEEAENLYIAAKSKYETLKDQLQKLKEEVENENFNTDNIHEQYENLVARGKKLKKEVDQIQKGQEHLKKLKAVLEDLEKQLEQRTEQKAETEQSYHDAKSTYTTEAALLNQAVEKIPNELQSLDKLHGKIQQVEQQQKNFEQKWKEAQERYQKASETLLTMTANEDHVVNDLTEIKRKLEQIKAVFSDQLQKVGFSNEQSYNDAKMEKSLRQTLKEEVDHYYKRMSTTAEFIKELENELSGKEHRNLEQLQETVTMLKEKVEEAKEASQQTKHYYQEAEKLKQHLHDAGESLKDIEKELQVMDDLYNVVRGDNPKKISFERYLQIEFLEQIILAANERLKQLSNGQYYLIRSTRREKHGKQSGLGLDVYDAYTGQIRDVKSLSGGEKFNASLCLALGMADVIQSFEGGISIETMFIDEGFGSLDEESLHKAIDTLVELQQSGRMIGVISHVQELKQAMPAILDVQKTQEGYSRTRFIVK